MAKRFVGRYLLLVSIVLLSSIAARAGELRGTWLARDSFLSRGALAEAMQLLAANNFNIVYVNVWSRGYPLWKSRVFERHTGILSPVRHRRCRIRPGPLSFHRLRLR